MIFLSPPYNLIVSCHRISHYYTQIATALNSSDDRQIVEGLAGPMGEEGSRILNELTQSHRALKEVEGSEVINDRDEVEKTYKAELNYLNIAAIYRNALENNTCDSITMDKFAEAEKNFCSFYMPPETSSRFKIWHARQNFLNTLQKAFLYLQPHGMQPSWQVDSRAAREILIEAANDSSHTCPPLKTADFYRQEAEGYQNPFSCLFLQAAIREVRNLFNNIGLRRRINLIEVTALNCIKNLVDLRVALDSNPTEFPLQIMAKFAHNFGVTKRLNFVRIIDCYVQSKEPS